MNENFKKVLKALGVLLLVLFLWGVFNLFFGGKNYKNQKNVNYQVSEHEMMDDAMGSADSMPRSKNNIGAGSALRSDMPQMEVSEKEAIRNSLEDGVQSDKKVIKNGNLKLQVEKTEKAADEIKQIAINQGGEVFATNFYEKTKGQKSGTIVVKVPVNKFEDTLSAMKNVSTQVMSESTTGQDVSAQYTDLEAQLRNKRAEEESFVAILDRAGDIDDVLAVTKQIARVRGEIERIQGRLKYLSNQTDMSTISVSISEDVEIAPVTSDWRPWQVIKKSFSELVDNTQDFVNGIIRFIIVGIPSLVPFLLFLWVIYWGVKKIYKRLSM